MSFFNKCKTSFCRVVDNSFGNNIANIILVVVAVLLIIALITSPGVLIALALLGLFLWALLC